VVPLHEGTEAVRASLDDTDLAIVRALQANARATYAEVGRAVGLSAASVHERVHRLEERVERLQVVLSDARDHAQQTVDSLRV